MAKAETKLLSNKEWTLMNAMWATCAKSGNATVSEVLDAVRKKQPWGFSTIKTMLERLVTKGVLRCTLRGRTAFYEPALRKETVAKRDITQRLDAILEGALGPLVSYLADRKKLTRSQTEELRRLFDDTQRGR